ncbi:hypothetical protein K461DRAFT_281463 [Myriangium duriaei CBS 260.36]|uniref:Uncharacterized protein n=1 Tax=Myriangium duriaei CBS 260.36 TaxID=1168546 RepID=A0A9P4IYM5_9PEZI|nr:hypothetical protein K461DRAFT_281463 [Myriangium duriaei CBS 260.36]
MDFILGLGIALPVAISTGIATTTGIAEGVSHQQKVNEENANESRQLKFHIDVSCDSASAKLRSQLHGGMVVLHSDRLWIEPRDKATNQPASGRHPFTGFYLPYPDEDRPMTRGMVSTISRDPPMLNWIYAEKEELCFKYANRTGSIQHHVGDWDWTEEFGPESCITFDGWEGFVAVEEEGGKWGLYFDYYDDGLAERKKGRKVVEVTLYRRVISEQEVNQWGLGSSGNLGVKKTEHEVKGKNMMDEQKG